jgi:predicted transcriptional regulator
MDTNAIIRDLAKTAKQCGVSQISMANRLKVSGTHLNRVLSGATRPSLVLLERMMVLRDKLKSSGLSDVG